MRRRLARVAVVVCALLGLLMVVVTATPLVPWWSKLLGGNWDATPGDVMIVLAADRIDDQTLGVSSYWRVVYAARVFRGGHFRRVVVTGYKTAAIMRDVLVCYGVPARVIEVEGAATSTRENALYTAKLLAGDAGPLVLVTSEMHMFRARRVFEKAGMHLTAAPYPYAQKLGNTPTQRWGLFVELVRETAKIPYYWARGWI